jgi:hypothetical protein
MSIDRTAVPNDEKISISTRKVDHAFSQFSCFKPHEVSNSFRNHSINIDLNINIDININININIDIDIDININMKMSNNRKISMNINMRIRG